jgi:hypothetical protein
MSTHAGNFTAGFLASAVYLAGSLSFSAMAADTPPVFTPDPSAGWFSYSRDWIPPASGPGPVRPDPKHPHVSNDDFRVTGAQPTVAVGDPDNPILQPWAREKVRERNERVLSGKPYASRGASCWPGGVLSFILSPMTRPMYIIQAPNVVAMIKTSFNDVRHIYLTDRHSENVKTSWYGESIGHYEGDTLVVDTIGLDDRTNVDGFGTPHTKQLHVVERWHLFDNGEGLQADVHIEDPGAFTMPWNAIQRYRQFEAAVAKVPVERLTQLATPEKGPLTEAFCAESPTSFFPGERVAPIPQASVPDF